MAIARTIIGTDTEEAIALEEPPMDALGLESLGVILLTRRESND